jgi:protocatechuate 3,4-dioxygenase beta subunit
MFNQRFPAFRFLHALPASVFVLFLIGPANLSADVRSVALRGRITDFAGAAIPGATVAAIAQNGRVRFSIADEEGRYTVRGLAPGKYVVWAVAKGYALYDNSSLGIGNSSVQHLDIKLSPESVSQRSKLVDTAEANTKPTRFPRHP